MKMKSILTIVTTLALMGATSLFAKTYTINKNSKVEWFATKVTGKHNGTINIKSGKIISTKKGYSGELVIDMNTIKVTNIPDAAKSAKLAGHLKSEDFFQAEKFPTSKLQIISTKKIKGNKYKIKGKLTIRDKTNDVSFDASIDFTKGSFKAVGQLAIDRSKFNVKYGSGSFFKGLGDNLIHDKFVIKFNLSGK